MSGLPGLRDAGPVVPPAAGPFSPAKSPKKSPKRKSPAKSPAKENASPLRSVMAALTGSPIWGRALGRDPKSCAAEELVPTQGIVAGSSTACHEIEAAMVPSVKQAMENLGLKDAGGVRHRVRRRLITKTRDWGRMTQS